MVYSYTLFVGEKQMLRKGISLIELEVEKVSSAMILKVSGPNTALRQGVQCRSGRSACGTA
jgi:hypothetical protein